MEHVEVHLGRQKLHSQLPEWEAITKSVLSHLFILGFENTTSDQSSIGLNQQFEPEKVAERESSWMGVVVVVRGRRLPCLQETLFK